MNYNNYEIKIDFFVLIFCTSISQLILMLLLSFFVSGPRLLLEGSVSQIFVLGLSFDFNLIDFNFLHYIKLNLGPKSKF